MTTYIKVEFETSNLSNLEESSKQISDTLKDLFTDADLEQAYNPREVQVKLDQPKELAVIETAVVLGLIGIATKLVDLYMVHLKREDEAARMDLEAGKLNIEARKLRLEEAKFLVDRLSDEERNQLREEFIHSVLPNRIFSPANVQPKNITVDIIESD